jgi:hypothetical protein
LNETNTTNSVGPYYLPGLGANGLFPVDAAGLIYSMTETRDRLTGCWGPGVNSPITYDIEAAWTDASSQGPPPPSCRGVTCQAGDPRCNDPGVCNPATGTCSPPKVRAGASCGGDYCTAAGTCDAQGTCVPGTEIPRCPVTDPECGGVVCVPATGACIYMANGQSCDDHNACTINDTCNKGTCLGTPQPCASEKKECYAAPQCDPALGCQPPLALVKGTRCNSGSVCYECNGGKCDPLSQSTVDMGCDQLIDETIKTCKESNNNTWRVDARTSAHGGTNYVACEETGGKKQIVDDWETNICSHAGGGERQTDYYCTGSIISKSAASDTQCARARDTTQGVCDAVCTVCVP